MIYNRCCGVIKLISPNTRERRVVTCRDPLKTAVVGTPVKGNRIPRYTVDFLLLNKLLY